MKNRNWQDIKCNIIDMRIQQAYCFDMENGTKKNVEYEDKVRIQIADNWGNQLYMNKESANKLWNAVKKSDQMKKAYYGQIKYDGCAWDFWKFVCKTANDLGIEYKCCA